MHVPECAFNGVENPSESLSGCDRVFAQWERDMIAQAIDDAIGDLSTVLHYYIGEKYLIDYGHKWTDPLNLKWKHVEGGGIEGLTAVTPSASDFTVDPAAITVAQADFPGGTDEIKIVDGEGLRIYPDEVDESGTDYIIYIDQCKLIEWDNLEDQSDPIDYDDMFPADTWLKLADLTVYRSYLDTTTQATIEFGPSCHCTFCGTACAGDDYTGCVWVYDPEISKVRVQLATYSVTDAAWGCTYPIYYGCYSGDKVTVRYKTSHYPTGWKNIVTSLANTKLAFKPCGCSAFDTRMQMDRTIPSVLTGERINCPLGLENGAWKAWKWAQRTVVSTAYML